MRALALLVVAFAVPVQARDQPSPEPDYAFGSPRAVFDAMNKAAKKKDFKTVMKCLTPESRDRMVAGLATAGASLRMVANINSEAKMQDFVAGFDKVLVKHGVTKEALARLEAAKDSEESAKAAKALAAPVKDKAAFVSDITALFGKLTSGLVDQAQGELKDVKTTGTKARGVMAYKVNGMEINQPIDFVKIGGDWLVVVPDVKAMAAPAPPPPPLKK
jgi:hypothetical protein